jgi:glutamate-1-semialdehyde aminotransferase
MEECRDVTMRDHPFDATPYQRELDSLLAQYGRRITAVITEPYLGAVALTIPESLFAIVCSVIAASMIGC